MDIISSYYARMLDMFVKRYGEQIETAMEGHCMKVTGFSMSVLQNLYERLAYIETNAQIYILSEEETGERYVTPTRLIELRNDLTIPLLVLIPANSSTSAEDSYGNATFQELSIRPLDRMLYDELIEDMGGNLAINNILGFSDKNLSATLQDKIFYLLYIAEHGYTDEAIGNGLYLLGLLPDEKIAERKEFIQSYLSKNDESIDLLCNFNLSISDRIEALPIKKDTQQKEIASFLQQNRHTTIRKKLCEEILNHWQGLNFANWSLRDIVQFGKLHVTKVVLNTKNLEVDDTGVNVKVDEKKDAKAKLRIYFSPRPSVYATLKKVRISLMNADGFYLESENLRTVKVTENKQEYRDVVVKIPYGQFDNGVYFFHVTALNDDGLELNVKDEFRDEDVQKAWEQDQTSGRTSKADFQQQKRSYLTSDSEPFYLTNIIEGEPDGGDIIGTRTKINNLLEAYFHYRIELNRKGLELDIPERQAIKEKSGKKTKSSEDDLKSWQYGTHTNTFQVRYDATNNYQIPLSKKLLAIEKVILDHSGEMGFVEAEVDDNYTTETLRSAVWKAWEVDVPDALVKKRKSLFAAIADSAPEESGVIETFEVFRHIGELKEYLEEYHSWLKDISSDGLSTEIAVTLQRLDTVDVTTEMPDGGVVTVRLIPPLHPLRLAWLVNIYELYEDWESKTHDDERYRKPDVWFKKLDQLFYGGLTDDVAPLVMKGSSSTDYLQYIGEMCFGWGMYACPKISTDDVFASGFRQLKVYLAHLLNVAVQQRIDSDVNTSMVYRLFYKYITQHPYTNKLIINIFNAGDAAVFAKNLELIEKRCPFDLQYEIRLFCSDKRLPQGEALVDLMNPDTQVSEEAEAFSQLDENRLFPKLRFSINNIDEFINNSKDFPAHLTFLVNPFPTQASLQRSETIRQSFYLNAVVGRPVVTVEKGENGFVWHRYMSESPLHKMCSSFAEESQRLFSTIQMIVAHSMSTSHEVSVPSVTLNIGTRGAILLSHVHDVSDWVVTFDKNMGPEFYDLPCANGETPYLLDYLPSAELNGISSFLTCRPTSEIEELMETHFKEFGIDISDKESFLDLLADVRSVSSSMIMQIDSTRNKAFEVLGTTLMKRMLKRKGLLEDTFIIPIDLHKDLFRDLDSKSESRADNLLVDFHTAEKEIVFTVVEIKCRKSLTDEQKESLQEKMHEQIENTILALQTHFDTEYKVPDRLDRELMTMELQSLLGFYVKRAKRYDYLCEQTANEYERFVNSLAYEDYTFKFKRLGIIYEFDNDSYQTKEVVNDTLFYTMGKPMIDRILNKNMPIMTADLDQVNADDDFRTQFETSDRIRRDYSFKFVVDNSEKIITDDSIQAENIEAHNETESVQKEQVLNQKEQKTLEDKKEGSVFTEQKGVVVNTESSDKNNTADLSSQIQQSTENVSGDNTPAEKRDSKPDIEMPNYDIMVGKTGESPQYGILGESINGHRKIAIDLSETNTISLFGVQGGGKSYTIGTVTEMTLKQFPKINALPGPMASVIFHYSESMDYAPEFTSMIFPNDDAKQLAKLKEVYGADAGKIEDVLMLCPEDKIEDRREEYPSLEIHPIKFHSTDLNVQDWMFLLKAVGNDSTYINQLKAIMRANRRNLNITTLKQSVTDSALLTNSQKALAMQRLSFAEEYIDDALKLGSLLKPGRLIIVDLRDEFIEKDDALGLFVIMLNIFAGVKQHEGKPFNKFIVFDEAHKYMDNKDLTSTIVTSIREMRHKGVSMMIASQDPMSLPTEIIELSSIMLMHKFNSPQWVKHVQKSITQLRTLSSGDMANLVPGEAYLWATKASDKGVTMRPMKISTRPRVTKHGGDTIKAI